MNNNGKACTLTAYKNCQSLFFKPEEESCAGLSPSKFKSYSNEMVSRKLENSIAGDNEKSKERCTREAQLCNDKKSIGEMTSKNPLHSVESTTKEHEKEDTLDKTRESPSMNDRSDQISMEPKKQKENESGQECNQENCELFHDDHENANQMLENDKQEYIELHMPLSTPEISEEHHLYKAGNKEGNVSSFQVIEDARASPSVDNRKSEDDNTSGRNEGNNCLNKYKCLIYYAGASLLSASFASLIAYLAYME